MAEKKTKYPWGLIALAIGSLVVMAAASPIDYSVTAWVGHHKWAGFSEFMSRSVFERDAFGGGDPVIVFLVVVVVFYGLSLRREAGERLRAWGPSLGFMVAGGLLSAAVALHSLKWLTARARPYLVFDGRAPYTHRYALGPPLITHGSYRGCFPSGHTAQAFAVMALAYALAGDPGAPLGRRWLGRAVGLVAVVYALAMGTARLMVHAHWLTDVLGAITISWLTLHVLYYHVLKTPQRSLAARGAGGSDPMGRGWDLLMALDLTLTAAGVSATVVTARAAGNGGGPWTIGAVIAALAVTALGARRVSGRLRQLDLRLEEGAPSQGKDSLP